MQKYINRIGSPFVKRKIFSSPLPVNEYIEMERRTEKFPTITYKNETLSCGVGFIYLAKRNRNFRIEK